MPNSTIRKSIREHVQRMETQEKATLEKFVEFESGRVRAVKWKEIVITHNEFTQRSSEGVDDNNWINVLRYLEGKNVLCFEERGYFPFNGIDCGPNVGGIRYHFVNRSDAEAYARAEFEKARYPIQIAKIVSTKAINK